MLLVSSYKGSVVIIVFMVMGVWVGTLLCVSLGSLLDTLNDLVFGTWVGHLVGEYLAYFIGLTL